MSEEADEKIEKVDKVSKGAKSSGSIDIADADQRVAPNKEHFDSLMGAPAEARKVDTSQVSLIDEVSNVSRKADLIRRATPQELVAQSQEVIIKIEELKEKLNTPNLELKSSMQDLLKNKLSHIDENLKIALNKAGVEYEAPQKVTAAENPVERFLGFLTDGQSKLETLSNEVNLMHLNRKELAPAAMLAIQIKVGFIQQELEFFTSLLNKALESTKTIMNVQV